MKKVTIIAAIAALLSLGWTHRCEAQGNLLTNGDFEAGSQGQLGSVTVPGWIAWGSDGWLHGDFNHTTGGAQAIKSWNDTTGFFQDFAAAGGLTYQVNAFSYSPSNDAAVGWNGIFKVEWFSAGGFVGSQDIGAFYGDGVDALNAWKSISADVTAPVSADAGRVVMFLTRNEGATTGGSVSWDDVSVSQIPEPSTLALFGLGLAAIVGLRRRFIRA